MFSRLMKFNVFLLALFVFGLAGQAQAMSPPVAMITQAKGTVEYSKGSKWKRVTRNKFVFDGYKVRTGADGSAKIVNQKTNMSREMAANSEVKISKESIELVSGQLSDPVASSGNLLASLNQRFAQAQRYTTVRRSVNKAKKMKISFAREITLSDQHPDLVWTNMGHDISYRLIIDGKAVEIPASRDQYIRYSVSGLQPGEHHYRIELVQGGQVVYTPRKDRVIHWLGGSNLSSFNDRLSELKAAAPGDDFLLANFFDEHGMTVAAMDLYRKYFQDNPDDIDMYPLLIKSYHDLKLSDLKKEAAIHYNEMLDQ